MNDFITKKDFTQDDLINEISTETTFNKNDVARILDSFIRITHRILINNKTASIPGLGKFIVTQSPNRHVYNPATLEKIVLPGERNISFKYYKKLKNYLENLNPQSPETKTMLTKKITTNMKTIFEHIAADTLTKEVLADLLAQGCNINMISRSGNTPLSYAYKKRKNNSIKLLLDNDANQTVYENEDEGYIDEFIDNGRTILNLAREDNNVATLLMLIKDKARHNAIKLQQIHNNPENYNAEDKQSVEREAWCLDNDQEPNICETIKKITATDSILKRHPQLFDLIESITKLEYHFDFTGGNADDKIEAATIELSIKNHANKNESITHHLEYFLLSNWSHADIRRMLLWRTGKKTRNILDIKNTELTTLSDHKKTIQGLAHSLLGKKNYVPLEHFVHFLVVLVSRIVQKGKRTIEAHREELGLQ